MISFQEALHTLDPVSEELCVTLHREEEHVALEWAVDRIAKHSYHSPRATPAYDTSAMDGFALCSKMTANASPESPATFCVDPNIVRAGGDCVAISPGKLEGCCDYGKPYAVEIMTGGRFPSVIGSTNGAEFDCCVRWEDTVVGECSGDHQHIQILKPAQSGQNKRFAACDFAKGDRILESGAVIRPKHIMALASVGFRQVTVLPKLRFGIWSTGDELMLSSNPERPDVNGPYLTSALRSIGAVVEFLGVVPDQSGSFAEELKGAVASGRYHVLISTGGVSAGKYDFVPSSVENLNATNVFHHVAIRPGHPVLFATIPSSPQKHGISSSEIPTVPFFGLPGNPIASAACFRFLVLPFLNRLLPANPEEPINGGKVEVTGPPDPPQHLDVFRHGNTVISRDGSKAKIKLNKDQSPAKIKPFMESTCWVHISRGGTEGVKQTFAL